MKKLLKKHWALIGFVVAFLLDQNTGVIAKICQDEFCQNLFKGLGAIILSYFWQSNNNIFGKDAEIGGSNTPPVKDEK